MNNQAVNEIEHVKEDQMALVVRVQLLVNQYRLSATDVAMVLSRMEHVIDDLDNLLDDLKK